MTARDPESEDCRRSQTAATEEQYRHWSGKNHAVRTEVQLL